MGSRHRASCVSSTLCRAAHAVGPQLAPRCSIARMCGAAGGSRLDLFLFADSDGTGTGGVSVTGLVALDGGTFGATGVSFDNAGDKRVLDSFVSRG